MNKQEFLAELKDALSGLPENEIDERLTFYGEMIDDQKEDGLSEEEIIAKIGSVDEIVSQTVSDIPLSKLVKEKIKPNRAIKVWEIILLILGSPVWLPLLIAAVAVIFSIYIVIWAAVITLWATEAAFAASAISCVAGGIWLAIFKSLHTGLAAAGTGFIFAGLCILLFFGFKAATKGVLILTKKIALSIKFMFVGKREHNA